ncbi:MAG TPA: lysophospholipid acyltransferase family protein [Jatrophihabitantaceae bacterium]|jgi:1-acyl-sn-glycerol-3-phosphate acyltransferase|nr:lysophospholipid acyltransferase family protein [Jatrophihabitantaceae bacterium]
MARPDASLTYRLVMAIAAPIVRWWGRLEVVGLAKVPQHGPTVLMANHDSLWDPLVIGSAAQLRQVRALAKASLWKFRPVAAVLDQMGQIPIERGRGDLAAMSAAVAQLEQGNCIGVFPEGTVSRGKALRALSGAGRLALAVPDVHVVAVCVTGSVDIARFPRRPRLRVEFFEPAGGQPRADESAVALTKRVMAEVRERAPYVSNKRRGV